MQKTTIEPLPPRRITPQDALSIVEDVYRSMGWVPDQHSSREQRNRWIEAGCAAVHYGHTRFNPSGGDPDWCIKDAGGGRPQSDEVIVRASTREFYDLILQAGAGNWRFHLGGHNYPLPREQNVYPPRESALEMLEYARPVEPLPPLPGPTPPPTTPTPPQGSSELLVLMKNLESIALENRAAVSRIEARQMDIWTRLFSAGQDEPSLLESVDDVKRIVHDPPLDRDPRFLK